MRFFCGKKSEEAMQGMELWEKSDWFWQEKIDLGKLRKDGIV